MSTTRDPARRLIELERILAQSPRAIGSGGEGADSVTAHLAEVPADRIRQFTSVLELGLDDTIDDIDAITMRLLLNDYTIGVAHLRAIARKATVRIDAAADLIRQDQRLMHQVEKLGARNAAPRMDEESSS